ncbi:hypothetical protein [Paenimyroides viscosum]|uniref:Uncharacterized protein n=1 Tax=Paenimyroides viscosum TaxID=2488729 RepID=A0A3P1B6Y5_9FLAO|nr:hypothetical protein [Paenimyroides viscosum]RRA96835.1 hypothetical protein EG242_02040 [Paenimyroides viscosum]
MKAIKILNTIVVAIPLALGLIDLILQDGAYLIYALWFTMITGGVQVLLGIILAIKLHNNLHFKIYLIGVVGYFFLIYLADEFDLSHGFSYLMFTIPALLAVYLSVLIYKLPNHEL